MKPIIRLIAIALAAVSTTTVAAAAPAAKTCRVNRVCAHYGTSYRVRSVKLAKTIGDGWSQERTSGVFVVLKITMVNLKREPTTILEDNLRIRTASGLAYEMTDKAFGLYDDGFFAIETLQPRLPETVTAVYELPRSVVHGARLEINDLYTDDKAYVQLGV